MFPPRYFALGCYAFGALLGVRDLRQTRHAILRNHPVIGHLWFLMEFIRPEIRQYFIGSDREAAPFSRAQRLLVYQQAKRESDNQPFDTHLDVDQHGDEGVNHSVQTSRLPTDDVRIRQERHHRRHRLAPSPTTPACSTSRR